MAGAELEGEADQEHPVTPHLVGAKTRPMTRFAMKQGPPTETLASSKRPTKTPEKGQAPRGCESSSRVKK